MTVSVVDEIVSAQEPVLAPDWVSVAMGRRQNLAKRED